MKLFESKGFSKLRIREVIWLADGAPYNWGLQSRLCPHAHGLLDFMHLRQHLFGCAVELFGENDACTELFVESASRMFLNGESEKVIAQLKGCALLLPNSKAGKKRVNSLRELWFFLERNSNRLDYKKFIDNGWPIGSGAIESAHKWVIQRRTKQAGMKWSPKNAQRMATMRALYASAGPEKFHQAIKLSHLEAA